jgi:hypothetical protein
VALFKHDLYFVCPYFGNLQFFFEIDTHPFYQADQDVYQRPIARSNQKQSRPLAGAGFVMAISIVGDGISGQA